MVFPWGKISPGELPEQALLREIEEELCITVKIDDVEFVTEIVAPSHDYSDMVNLHVYKTNSLKGFVPSAEISEIRWFPLSEVSYMAPAVIMVLEVLDGDV
ncbi:NUDIX domain-containing protein [Photobacterium leiognathi]|uniref:NUDIX domain-containing protein n=1 Tax=Photobacterium leiognathi TaxID=553611 RepID=UPI00273A1C26|nr:NUDIX domain-containing protein [Photobacterium leiognathi]